ncbi:phosphate acyltransferase PlsX [Vallitalea sp.]|jgi:glycerol-3-phosphate acyltransferase PlsX|uniref:phosphate acyltransferase PlsX n=1 Tax=Vallitalea sp. TaxID=1882829 RepID=UPI0025E02B25|nr:phosphate acyltransferase PlsX [Vallitalea sp.]MCT4687389.1 phosphate acyltransferase PlsX [Vallitalea sp.]
MQEMITVAVDAMGGDNAPNEIIKGCIESINDDNNIKIYLVGNNIIINEQLTKYTYNKEQLEVVDAKETIDTCESPVMAIRRKKDSSLVKGLNLVKEKKANAFVSAGSTGAILAGGTFIVGRIKGIERPALAPLIPHKKGVSLLIDCGANVDSKASYLVQYAKMGSIYFENVLGVKNPKVALINIGEEKSKGNNLVKETYSLLQNEDINFIGNIEARDIPEGKADILVCDAFVGNIILKYTEGFALTMFSMLKKYLLQNIRSKIGTFLLKPALKNFKKSFDYTEYGGAPLLGLEGLVVKTHGSSDAKAIKNTILQCKKFSDQKINKKIKENIKI